MPLQIEELLVRMRERPDPRIFRSIAYVTAFGIVGTDKLLGGTWWAIPATAILLLVASFIFPARPPKDRLRKKILVMLHAARDSSFRIRFACTVLMVVGVSALDHYLVGIDIGREFNLYLIPIFVASQLFGLPLAILTWLLSLLAVYYCVIPPRYSLEIGSVKDLETLIEFFYLGLLALAVGMLMVATSISPRERISEMEASRNTP